MTRVISGVLLAAAALAAIFLLPFVALRVLACLVAGFAADEYVRITSAARSARTDFERSGPWRAQRVEGLSRWIVIAAVVFSCWWSAVPAPLSIVLLAIVVIVWLAFAVLRRVPPDQAKTRRTGEVHSRTSHWMITPLGMLGLGAMGTLLASSGIETSLT